MGEDRGWRSTLSFNFSVVITKRFKKKAAIKNSMKHSISVIIPAYNEEKYLEPTLQSVVNQQYGPLELIVVPNGCTDRTVEVAARFTSHVYDTRERGIGRSKNVGYEKANGELIVFLDADTRMQEGVLDLMAQTLEHKYIGGKTKILPEDTSLSARAYFGWVNTCGRLSQLFTYLNPRWNNGAGACLFSSHEQLDALRRKEGHVFREDIKTMEDVDLISRLRARGPFKFLTERGVITSTRRFREEGYLKRFFIDFAEHLNPKGIENRRDIR